MADFNKSIALIVSVNNLCRFTIVFSFKIRKRINFTT